jgi:WD40 repeat protein
MILKPPFTSCAVLPTSTSKPFTTKFKHQVGSVWSGAEDIVSLSMSGDLNVFDRRSGDKPARILNACCILTSRLPAPLLTFVAKRPQKPITAFAPTSSDTFLAGSADGRVLLYSARTGEATLVRGEGHGTLITGLAAVPGGKALSIGFDDRVREMHGGAFM